MKWHRIEQLILNEQFVVSVFDNAWARSEEEQKDGEKLMGDNYNLEAYWQEKM